MIKQQEINYALVEEKRPPIYTAMKYWGKKPHNIWREYINCYTPKHGNFLDPFCGSAMSAFEAVNAGKNAYAFDLNPLTSFIIEVFSSNFDQKIFIDKVNRIFDKVQKDKVYRENYSIKCPHCSNNAIVVNFKWDSDKIYEIAAECPYCKKRFTIDDVSTINHFYSSNINIPYWYPTWEFNNNGSFQKSFIKTIGGNKFSDLWTRRNLYLLSLIFNFIEQEDDDDLKMQLLFGFIQTLHLCSKMCIPRRKQANRDFSTSWGRSAFICGKRQMEMNPLYLFKGNCIGKQSVSSALLSAEEYLKIKPRIYNINNEKSKYDDPNLFYGIIDSKNITKFIPAKSIDFILTDPPYGGLVKYFDLSSIWLSWMVKIDNKYLPDYENEVTTKNNDENAFYNDLLDVFKNLYIVLKDHGKIVFTFNNQDLNIWNMFLNAITDAGFKIEKVLHQQNKRTGESNVSSKFGMSSSDFYIRCIKSHNKESNKKITIDEYEQFIVDAAEKIILDRKEPTNYDILFAGILGKLSLANYNIKNCDEKIENILKKYIDKKFIITNENKWFLLDYKIKGKTLTQKVSDSIIKYFTTHKNCNRDELLGIIFKKFPNGLTPDPIVVNRIIDEIFKGAQNDKK